MPPVTSTQTHWMRLKKENSFPLEVFPRCFWVPKGAQAICQRYWTRIWKGDLSCLICLFCVRHHMAVGQDWDLD